MPKKKRACQNSVQDTPLFVAYCQKPLSASALIRDFVEAGIYVVGSVALTLCARHNQAHKCRTVVGTILTTQFNKGQRYEPAGRYRCRTVCRHHHTTYETARKETAGIRATHHFGIGSIGLHTVSRLNGISGNIELHVTIEHCSRFTILQLLAATLTYNLHINTGTAKEHVFILADIRRTVIGIELTFRNHLDIPRRVKQITGRVGGPHLDTR